MASAGPETLDFIVARGDLRRHRLLRRPAAEVAPQAGQILLRVSQFAFTSNNVSYALMGDLLSYWSFFPTQEGWGRVPVWGFGDVVETRDASVREGERIFGYLPMSTHLLMQPAAATPRSFIDASPHRSALPLVYNQYTRVAQDPAYDERYEAEQMLFLPLFMTAFLLEDFLAESDFFGARAVLLSSASSKTAIGLAFLLARARRARIEAIGLTSPAHVPFVEGLGCYDRVLPYDELRALPPEEPVVLVDMAGNGELIGTLHRHFGERMRYSCLVGATHWERGQRESELPGAPPTFFFAPTRIEKRRADWGRGGLEARFGQAWGPFVQSTSRWLELVEGHGPAAVERVYRETLEGRARPSQGHLLSLFERAGEG